MKPSYLSLLFLLLLSSTSVSCQKKTGNNDATLVLSDAFKSYWYEGTAEISTYQLQQNRYNEIRKGTATLIYVTEDFLPQQQVKADNQDANNIPVLKLNSTKKFLTGVYPYSIMQSSFLPLQAEVKHALKVSASVQEWCGHTYLQLNNRTQFEITGYSYFETEGDQKISLDKTYLENELWNLIRINGGKNLPIGDFNILPSLESLRLKHIEIKAYKATTSLKTIDTVATYTIQYPELKRILSISFQTTFPFIIEGWSEKIAYYPPTIATRITTKQLPYWRQNSTSDEPLRKELGLQN